MNHLVVNCSWKRSAIEESHNSYNLGAHKLADWLRSEGHTVEYVNGDPGMFALGFDKVWLSVVFSWDATVAASIANRVKDHAEVEVGGPGMTQMHHFWPRETGLPPATMTKGVDKRFDRQRGDYLMTFASRGCPVNCWFCIVPRLEGVTFTLDPEFVPAPILCDNNLSALPVDFQEHIIRRYQETGTPLRDANSGFEPRTFDAGTRKRWETILLGPWRFAYDDMQETEQVKTMMALLSDVPARKKRVYVLCGNEPIEECHERAQKVIEWGAEPHLQFVLPLHWLGDSATLNPKHGWTHQMGRDFCRFYNGFVFRSCPISDYHPRVDGIRPFANL